MQEILKKHADKLRFLIVLYQHSLPFCSHFLQIKNILSSQHPKT